MDTTEPPESPPPPGPGKGGKRAGAGRKPGTKDGQKRWKAPAGVLPREIIEVAKKELVSLGPDGRSMDEIGILRSVGLATVGLYCRELPEDGPDANERRKVLIQAFEIIHKAQVEAIKLFGLGARNIDIRELPSLEMAKESKPEEIEPQLADWRARRLEDEEAS